MWFCDWLGMRMLARARKALQYYAPLAMAAVQTIAHCPDVCSNRSLYERVCVLNV